MSYQHRSSPLHAASAAVALIWCGALLIAAIGSSNPVWLAALVTGLCGAGALAGVGAATGSCLRFALPLAVTIALINALVTRNGLTVIWRLGDLPVLGQANVTLQATVYGGVLGLRAVAIVLVATLYSTAVDPDDLLRLLRRSSFSSGLSAAVATRMVPVLIRDSQRLADAQRCRPGARAGRVQLLHATTAGVVDRALDIAATLEVRGYGLAHQAPRAHRAHSWPLAGRGRRPSPLRAGRQRPRLGAVNRHDAQFLAGAALLVAATVAGRLLGATSFTAYPRLQLPSVALTLAACAGLGAAVIGPLLDRRGVES